MSKITSSKKALKLTWNIHKYSECIQRLGEGLYSPRFEIESLGPISWCLVYYPSGYKNPNYVACFLKRCDGDGYRFQETVVDLEMCLKAESGAEHFLQITCNLLFKNGYSLGFPEFITCKELRRCPFPNDILTLQCYVSPSNDSTKYIEDFIPLSNDIKLLHDETTFYDVIILVDKHEFKVHKPLLIARFPSLINKIECSHYEESIPFVKISDFSPEIVREVLHFVYTGKLTTFRWNRKNHTKLKEFASKYGMVNLLSKLEWDIDECIITSLTQTTKTNHLLPLKHEVRILSVALPGNHSEYKLKLRYSTAVCAEGIKMFILIIVEINSDCKFSLLAKFKGSITCDKQTVSCYERSFHMTNCYSGSNVKLGILPLYWFEFFIKKDAFPKNVVIDQEYMNYEWKVSFSPSSIETLPSFSDSLTSFSNDMHELFQSGIGTDLVLVTVLDGAEFNVHKSVVCARVPSLMAMFKDDTLAVNGYVHDDLKNVKVDISGIDSNTFRAILKYIYSGKIEVSMMNKVLKQYPKMIPVYMKHLQKQSGRNGNLIFRKPRNNKAQSA